MADAQSISAPAFACRYHACAWYRPRPAGQGGVCTFPVGQALKSSLQTPLH